MALSIKGLPRAFSFSHNGKDLALDDPNPSLTPDQVMSFFANQYAQLTTATVQGPEIKGDKALYTFKTTLGTKG